MTTPSKPRNMQARNWCWTSYEIDRDFTTGLNVDVIRYLVYQKEICPKTNRPHFQGYAELYKPRTMGGFKKAMGTEKIHVAPRIKSQAEARNYCMKEDTRADPTAVPIEYGIFEKDIDGNAGKRTDLEACAKHIEENGLDSAIFMYAGIYMRYHGGMEKLASHYQKKRKLGDDITVTVLWGVSGAGKTYQAWTRESGDVYIKDPTQKWWDGYNGEEAVIIDEIKTGQIVDMSTLLRWIDRYPCRVERKGSSNMLNARRFYLTSNQHPKDWYPNEYYAPLERRITSIEHFPDVYKPGGPTLSLTQVESTP